jgi:hypothetical protein
MENQDNLFNKIKTAAHNAETKDFESMEKVWSRIDAKLDTKVQKKNNKRWNKLAIAASLLLVVSLLYQFLKPVNEIITPQNKVVVNDDIKIINPDTLSEKSIIVDNETPNPLLKENADVILKTQIQSPTPVAIKEAENTVAIEDIESRTAAVGEITNEKINKEKSLANSASSINTGKWVGNQKYDAVGVQYTNDDVVADSKLEETKDKVKKQKPLLVIDDEVKKGGYENLDKDEIESIIELKEPLYIINGENYTEEELYGDNPTSPYAPLNKQKIETVTVLEPEKAKTVYGKKGEKGVVIITTKNGKPASKK